MKTLILLMIAAVLAVAQSGHSVTLNWGIDGNPTGTTYTAYRATGLCSGTPGYSKIAEGITERTFVDDTVQAGNYCYVVTATANGMESAHSNTAQAPVPAFPPTGLQVEVQ